MHVFVRKIATVRCRQVHGPLTVAVFGPWAPEIVSFEAGRPRLRLWVQNDRKKIRLHREPVFWHGRAFYYPKRAFEWLTRGGANIWCSIDAQPQISRFRGRDRSQNDRMVPNYPRIPVHVPACSTRKLIWSMRCRGRFRSRFSLSTRSGVYLCLIGPHTPRYRRCRVRDR